MIHTLRQDQAALQMRGEALSRVPMPMRATHPVPAAIRQQVSALGRKARNPRASRANRAQASRRPLAGKTLPPARRLRTRRRQAEGRAS